MDYEFDRSAPSGGRAGSGGGFYHLSFRSGSRGGGASASASFDYISRRDEYADRDLDEALYSESEHMPSWAAGEPEEFWDAADLYERANGRLYVSADFALPRDLSFEEQVQLARDLARELTDEEHLPYTLAIHAGRDEDGHAHNPHAHLMFSERRNDGIERSREEWFGRANAEHPERGGAPKRRTFHGAGWVEQARERWASRLNEALDHAGRSERVDHRSYERQGLDRPAGEHYGPPAAHMMTRSEPHDRLTAVAQVADDWDRLRDVEREIAALEVVRGALVHEVEERFGSERGEGSGGSHGGGWSRDEDSHPGR